MLQTLAEYTALAEDMLTFDEKQRKTANRHLARTDVFWLLWQLCKRDDMFNQWLLDRCIEVQTNPDGYLDLWAREHYKSTIITFGMTMQDVLSSHGNNPDPKWNGRETTISIFSATRALAMQFLRQIKQEFERNTLLQETFPDILYTNPQRESEKWSEDDGLIVRRTSNPKEATIEAWGLIDGQPTSKHFLGMIYDDVVTVDNTLTPYQIEKTTQAWQMSANLGTEGGYKRHVGTIYKFNDTYKTIKDSGVAIPRQHPATVEGTWPGTSVFRSLAFLEDRYKQNGVYNFSSQYLMNPVADTSQGFQRKWLQYHMDKDGANMNIYIIIDPANAKKRTSDYTAITVIGLGSDQNYYVLDFTRDRLNLTERADRVFNYHRHYKRLNPYQQIPVGYEHYGMQADISHIADRQARENYRFEVIPLGGSMPKIDRIKRLIPLFEQKRIYLPEVCYKTDYQKKTVNLVETFIEEEYAAFPVPVHDDQLDSLARILDEDLNATFPMIELPEDRYRPGFSNQNRGSAWAS